MWPASHSAEVWLANVEVGGRELDDLGERLLLLPEPERARMAAIPDPCDRRRWRRSRLALRLLLAVHAGVECARMPFAVSSRGKPVIAGEHELDFSLSHSGALALVGITPFGRIGVDIETRSSVDMDDRRRAGIEATAAALAPAVPLAEQGSRRLLQAWTRLEAVAKASGMGIGHVLTRIGIRGGAAGLPLPPSALTADLLMDKAGELRVEDLALDPPAVGAVALSREMSLVFRQLPAALDDLIDVARLALPRG